MMQIIQLDRPTLLVFLEKRMNHHRIMDFPYRGDSPNASTRTHTHTNTHTQTHAIVVQGSYLH